jgi:histone deacetylase complex regulatory component SIN3
VCHKRAFSSAHYTQKVDIKIPTIISIGAKKGDETLHFVNTQKKMAQVQTNDALVYVRTVKVRFSQEPAIYEDFLNVMRDFKSGR